MVSSTVDCRRHWRVVIRPNRSLTQRQLQLAFLGIAAVCLGIAGAFTAIGLWPILPFAGAEVIVVGIGLYLSASSGQETEVVLVDGETLAVEKGRGNGASDGKPNGRGRRYIYCPPQFAGARRDSCYAPTAKWWSWAAS